PAGLTLSSSGVLSGTTTIAGSFAFTVTATDSSTGAGPYSSNQNYTLTVNPAAPSQLVIHTQPSSTATAGQTVATQPVIYVEDSFGNLETNDTTTQVRPSLHSGSGPLQGTTTVTISGGIATFTDLAANKAETISLDFISGSLTNATSAAVTVS